MGIADAAEVFFRQQPTPHILMDVDLMIVDANDAYLAMTGRDRDGLVGRPVFDAFPPEPEDLDADGEPNVKASMLVAVKTGRADTMPLVKYDIRDSATGQMAERWWSLIHFPVLDPDGNCVLVAQRTEDVTDVVRERSRSDELRHRAEAAESDYRRSAVELARALQAQDIASRRLAVLALAALRLATAETLGELPGILSEAVAVGETEGAGLLLRGDDGNWLALINPRFAQDLRDRFAHIPHDSPMPAPTAARTGRVVWVPDATATDEFGEEMREIVERTGRTAWASFPLLLGTEVLGALTLSWAKAHTLDAEERTLFEGFAAQVAQTVARVRARDEQRAREDRSRALSEALQRSMLSHPPRVPGLQIAVRYRPATLEAQVGGDWYDIFPAADGSTLLVIGDISGHDRNAAAAMGQLRNLLRGLAFENTDGPAALLSRLDRALAVLDIGVLATCVVVAIAADGTFTWSSAGHPPPLLRSAGSSVTRLDADPDLLLGLDADLPRTQRSALLEPGGALLLYTDGLVEQRGASIEDGIVRVEDVFARGPVGAEDLAARLLVDAPAIGSEDDVAFLVVRRSA